MKIGIFLGYAPHTVLKKEGLGRYIANLISGFIDAGNTIVIACPKWLIPHVNDLLDDFLIDKDEIEFIVSKRVSSLWKLYDKFFYRQKQSKKRKSGLLSSTIKVVVETIISLVISITNMVLLIGTIILITLMTLIMLPIAMMCGIVYGILRLGIWILRKTKVKFRDTDYLKSIGGNFKNSGYNFYLYVVNYLQENATEDLVRIINRTNNKVDIWYSPAFFWQAFNKIEGVKVINAPDLVTAEFPELFAYEKFTVLSLKNIKKTIANGEYFITYCNYIKNSLLISKFNKESRTVRAIPHGVNSMTDIIRIDTQETNRLDAGDSFSKAFARSILQTLPPNNVNILPYTGSFVFANTKYLFYASQARPHKNLLNLVKAYENVLRKRYYSVKLILTCNLDSASDVKSYILEKRLQNDILTFQNISNKQLAALYYCAELVVNPTLYEGGFPFTFSEGMSVNTPSIMSNIPQVEEVIQGYGLDDCIFDPYDVKDMEDKIVYGLEHREELVMKQRILFDDLNERTWKVVASEYLSAFQSFLSIENAKNR